MRVPVTGQPLFERRIVREGKLLAERMLDGYSVTRNGRFVRADASRNRLWAMLEIPASLQALSGLFRRSARSPK